MIKAIRILALVEMTLLSGFSISCSTEKLHLPHAGSGGAGDVKSVSSVISGAISQIPAGMQAGVGPVMPAGCTPNVAAVPLQRMTRAQYQASVVDLLALPNTPTLDLPSDEQQGPFNANGSLLLADLNLVQYQAAAEQVVASAMPAVEALLPCKLAAMDSGCMATFISQFGLRAARRPLTSAEQQDYAALAAPYLGNKDAATAVQTVLEAMLQSPFFLFRLEYGVTPATAGASVKLSAYELAARLSLSLVGSAPDAALLQTAADGSILTQAGLLAQAQRLMATPAFARTAASFIAQWLGLNTLPTITKDPTLFPNFTPALLAAMQQEQVDFTTYVLQKADGRLPTLLSAPYSVLSDPLFTLYGVSKPANYTPGSPVQLDPKQRAGILSQAAFLATNAHETKTSVVLRGKIIRENLLCQPMPPPPPNVASLPQTAAPNSTAREVFAAHEANPACASCHLLMDPVGLTFENFDAVGAWRTQEGSSTIDPSGSLKGTPASNADVANFVGLAATLAGSPDVSSCFVKQAFRFQMSRLETASDSCEITNMNNAFKANNQDIRQLMLAVILSDSFRVVSQN